MFPPERRVSRQRFAVGTVFAVVVARPADFPVGRKRPFYFGLPPKREVFNVAYTQIRALAFEYDEIFDIAAESRDTGGMEVRTFPDDARIDLAVLFGMNDFPFGAQTFPVVGRAFCDTEPA